MIWWVYLYVLGLSLTLPLSVTVNVGVTSDSKSGGNKHLDLNSKAGRNKCKNCTASNTTSTSGPSVMACQTIYRRQDDSVKVSFACYFNPLDTARCLREPYREMSIYRLGLDLPLERVEKICSYTAHGLLARAPAASLCQHHSNTNISHRVGGVVIFMQGWKRFQYKLSCGCTFGNLVYPQPAVLVRDQCFQVALAHLIKTRRFQWRRARANTPKPTILSVASASILAIVAVVLVGVAGIASFVYYVVQWFKQRRNRVREEREASVRLANPTVFLVQPLSPPPYRSCEDILPVPDAPPPEYAP